MKKFLNGIALLLCVMSFCVFAGCSYAGSGDTPDSGAPDSNQPPQPGQVADPVFNPESGDIDYGDTVEITCATEGASIHYTTDGTDPSAESSTYTLPIAITSNTTIKAIAIKTGMTSSEPASSTYTVKSYTVTFDANGHGTAPDPITDKHKGETITLSELTESGYTFDGWTDGENSFRAGTEYTIKSDVILKAKWIGWNDVTTPSFSVTDNAVDYGDTVEITCATFGADIYYTTDGTAPTSSST
ncbi:MAG: chitobiase/beta-hexosaminidase C-terminal domain-containing protein, partial [Treponema sp.]|nr:chitobiase/beta-hexosaminidase C-terminal domain-containing protein [Candidatus Treponema merdequi]